MRSLWKKLRLTRPRKETTTVQGYDHPQTNIVGTMRTKTIAHLIIDWLRRQSRNVVKRPFI
ncbi:MAG: hypothetical protein HZA12_07765 [Nitrospirae bacterium]|nr:hypothetical protein [Nitrospirota bacterium]